MEEIPLPEFPDIDKYAKAENLSHEVLEKAFSLEAHYHRLLLAEKIFEKRLQLYDEFYSKLLPIYSRDTGLIEGKNPKEKYVRLFAKELCNASIVDYGCGQGHMLKSIDELVSYKKLTGIDVFIPQDLKTHPRINFSESNIINHKSVEKFDVAISDNVLEHLVPEDAKLHLNCIYENLNVGGKLIIIMPNRHFSPWDITRIIDFSQSGKIKAQGGHVNESTHTEMIQQLKEVGFTRFSTILPIPKIKYLLFRKIRLNTRWIKFIENSPLLLRLIKSVKVKGESVLKFPVLLIAEK